MGIDVTLLLAILTGFFGPILAYLAAARKLSGKISTSEASDLWEEAGRLRAEYKKEVDDLRVLVVKLRERVEDLEDKNEVLHLENGELRKQVANLKSENRRLKARVEELERELELINGQN